MENKNIKVIQAFGYSAFQEEGDVRFLIEDKEFQKKKEEMSVALASLGYRIVGAWDIMLKDVYDKDIISIQVVTDMPYEEFQKLMEK